MSDERTFIRDDEQLRPADAVHRAQRVAAVRRRIDSGTYKPAADAVAESLVAWVGDDEPIAS